MAAALAHAGAPPSPPAVKAGPNLKAGTAGPGPKPGVPAGEPQAPKAPFQALLDKAAQAASSKAGAPSLAVPPGEPKAPAPKAKAPETAEKPKEPKKTEAKDPKDRTGEGPDLVWAAVLQTQPKAETAPKPSPVPAGAAAESAAVSADKAKAGKEPRKTGNESLNTGILSQAAAEAARTQGQAPAPRTERTEDRQKVFVVDRRSDKEKEKLKTPGAEAPASQPVNAPVEVQPLTKAADPKAPAEVQATFQTVAGKGGDGFDLKGQNAPVAPRDAVSFQQYLVQQGYGQLVDQARIVLKDQNAGEIRMTLYPESLGKVKVSLNLDDNSLAGQIYVENQTVKDVFQANMDGLMQAFKDGGYTDLSLQVSVGNGSGGGNASQGQPQSASPARDYGRQVAQTAPAEARSDRIGSWNDRQINLTA